jgi:hypothetical protein
MNTLKTISLCVLFLIFGCSEENELSPLQIKFKNTTPFSIESILIGAQTIGTLHPNESTNYIAFDAFNFDTGLPDEHCTGTIDNKPIESYNKFYWCGTQKNTVYEGIFEMNIHLVENEDNKIYLILKVE